MKVLVLLLLLELFQYKSEFFVLRSLNWFTCLQFSQPSPQRFCEDLNSNYSTDDSNDDDNRSQVDRQTFFAFPDFSHSLLEKNFFFFAFVLNNPPLSVESGGEPTELLIILITVLQILLEIKEIKEVVDVQLIHLQIMQIRLVQLTDFEMFVQIIIIQIYQIFLIQIIQILYVKIMCVAFCVSFVSRKDVWMFRSSDKMGYVTPTLQICAKILAEVSLGHVLMEEMDQGVLMNITIC